MPSLTWSLVATISREADLSVAQRLGGWVDGDRVVSYMVRNASVELWRSDDRGVTWAFHTVTGLSGVTNITGPSDLFDSKYWIKSQADNLLVHTPASNPGAGGFTGEATGAISPVHYPQSNDTNLYLIDDGIGGTNQVFRRTGAATFTGLNMGVGDVYQFLTKIPGTSDLLLIQSTATGIIRRITPAASPVTLVNDFTMAQINFNNAPVSPIGCLSSTEYYVSAGGVDSDPAIIYRTTNGGTSWSATNPSAGFWEAFASGGRQGHATGFVRHEGSDYCFITFKDAALPLETQEHVKVAKFNGTSWDPESDDTNDGFRVIHTLTGLNAAGNRDFYAVTYDAATNTAKVYRTTEVVATPLTLAATSVEIAAIEFITMVDRDLAAMAVGVAGVTPFLLPAGGTGGEDDDSIPPNPFPPGAGEVGQGGFAGLWRPIGPIKKVEGVKLGGFTRPWLERHRRRDG